MDLRDQLGFPGGPGSENLEIGIQRENDPEGIQHPRAHGIHGYGMEKERER